jgi:hypothetical protein
MDDTCKELNESFPIRPNPNQKKKKDLPGIKPRTVSPMLIKRSVVQPRSKKTPRGGRMMAFCVRKRRANEWGFLPTITKSTYQRWICKSRSRSKPWYVIQRWGKGREPHKVVSEGGIYIRQPRTPPSVPGQSCGWKYAHRLICPTIVPFPKSNDHLYTVFVNWVTRATKWLAND